MKFQLRITGDLGFEFWQDIPGYEGLYQASTYGKIRSVERICIRGRGGKVVLPEKIMAQGTDRDGYSIVGISVNSKKQLKKVHRLIAETFLPNPLNFSQVNHKDEVKSNNFVSNLEYCDCKYNIRFGSGIERSAQKRRKRVLQFDLAGNYLKTWDTAADVERELGVYASSICRCCNGKMRIAYGYKWKYAEE